MVAARARASPGPCGCYPARVTRAFRPTPPVPHKARRGTPRTVPARMRPPGSCSSSHLPRRTSGARVHQVRGFGPGNTAHALVRHEARGREPGAPTDRRRCVPLCEGPCATRLLACGPARRPRRPGRTRRAEGLRRAAPVERPVGAARGRSRRSRRSGGKKRSSRAISLPTTSRPRRRGRGATSRTAAARPQTPTRGGTCSHSSKFTSKARKIRRTSTEAAVAFPARVSPVLPEGVGVAEVAEDAP